MSDEATDDEWKRHFGNAMLIAAHVPDEGDCGEFPCPCCKIGIVQWGRARSNKHIRFRCSGCKVGLIQ